MKTDYVQLSIFGDEDTISSVLPVQHSKRPKQMFHIYATDKFDNHQEDDIEAVSWKQAVFFFKKKHGMYWQCHP